MALERNAKRPPGGDGDSQPVSRADFDSLSAQLQSHSSQLSASLGAQLSSQIASSLSSHSQAIDSMVRTVVGQIQHQVDDGFHRCDVRLVDLETRVAGLEHSAPRIDTEIKQLQDGLAVAAAPVGDNFARLFDDFDRAPVPGLVQIRSSGTVAFSDLEQLVVQMLGELRLERSAVELRGKSLDKFFRLQFVGQESLAAARAAKFLGLQRTADGWRERFVADPEGQGQEHRIVFDFDKSRKQVRTEMLTKRAAAALRREYPRASFQLRRQEGKISYSQVPLLQIRVPDADTFELKWNLALLHANGWQRDELNSIVEPALQSMQVEVSWG